MYLYNSTNTPSYTTSTTNMYNNTHFTYIGAGVWCVLFGGRVLWHATCRVGTTDLSLSPPGNVEH